MNRIISVNEAREILGDKAADMSDSEVEFVIDTLDLMAKDALSISREKLMIKRDAHRLAKLTYDIYKDEKNK